MEWKIVDKEGNFLSEASCQYDCCDLAVMEYDVKIIEIDFEQKTARISK